MKFTQSHEWIDENGVVGITDYAKKELGEIVYVELPKVGRKVKPGEQICVIESTKSASDIYSPVSGTVLAVNEFFLKDPSWLIKMAISTPSDLNSLLSKAEYDKFISG